MSGQDRSAARVQECVVAIREQEEKLTALHEAQMRAYDQMYDAIGLHRAACAAYDHAAKDERRALRYDLEQAIKQAADEAVAAV